MSGPRSLLTPVILAVRRIRSDLPLTAAAQNIVPVARTSAECRMWRICDCPGASAEKIRER